MKDGFIKIACATPDVKVANCSYNAERIVELITEAHRKGVKFICFPELSITGYTCGDLFLQDALLNSAKKELARIIKETEYLDIVEKIASYLLRTLQNDQNYFTKYYRQIKNNML